MTLGVKESAEILEVHPNTVRNWTKEGVLTDVRIQGAKQARYDEQEVRRLALLRQAPTYQSYPRERGVHQVAVTVFVEAEGVDAHDAGAGAVMAINRLIHTNHVEEFQDMPTSITPKCSKCYLEAGVTGKGVIKSHYPGEHGPVRKPYKPCSGTGKAPWVPDQPVVGFVRADRLRIAARVFDVMETGMAAGNGHLWIRPTRRSYR